MTSFDNSDGARWRSVTTRDATADGAFFYAVKTTGVFCKPSCPARTPKHENVAFFDTAAAAQAAGYRPCRRCHPIEIGRGGPHASLMQAMVAYIDAHLDEPLPLSRLADEAGMSPFHFQRTFKAVIGVTPKEYQAAARLKGFKRKLRAGDSIAGAGFETGYGSTSRIYEKIDGGLGMTPSAYRAGGAGETIVHAVRETPLGFLMMAATQRGVCFVHFGATEAALLDELRREFPRATLQPATVAAQAPLDAWMEALAAHLAEGAPRPDLPLDLRGTAFQIKVWRFLLSVPEGDVVSYSEVAQGIAEPRAVRAAANACGANCIAVLIPCHRALRADGGLGGYRWGLDRKRALLAAENRAANS